MQERLVVSSALSSDGDACVVELGPDVVTCHHDLVLLWPEADVIAQLSDERAFRAAYRLQLFRHNDVVAAIIERHRRAPLCIRTPPTPLGSAVADVLDEFFAAWAPC